MKCANLGELIDLLKRCKQDADVVISAPVRLSPHHVSSYRGYYEDLAIEMTGDGDRPTVASLGVMLEAAVNQRFTGYKGGDFTMTRHTRVWLSNYGECTGALVVGVTEHGWCVTIDYEMEKP